MTQIRIATAKEDSGTFAGLCLCGYSTEGWATQKIAAERIEQHRNEHETGEPMESLAEFRDRHGLASRNLKTFPKGAKEIKKEES